jgi:hypothetical protein
MYGVIIDYHSILLGVHVDDFAISACANCQALDAFCMRPMETFEGTY